MSEKDQSILAVCLGFIVFAFICALDFLGLLNATNWGDD